MRSALASLAWMALLPPGTLGLGASEALQEYLAKYPITTKSAAAIQGPEMDTESLVASVLASNYSSRPWSTQHQRCPASCLSLGVDSVSWPVYRSTSSLLDLCDEPLLLSFALNTPVDGSAGRVGLRGCTGDLSTTTTTTTTNSSCPVHNVATNTTTTSLEMMWDSATGTTTSADAVSAMEQLLAYESMSPSPCNETIGFAYSGSTAVGVYMGSSLHRQNLLAAVLQALIDRIETEGVTDTLAVQLCGSGLSARYTMGIIVASNLADAQDAVQTWHESKCLSGLTETASWSNITYSAPAVSNSTAKVTSSSSSSSAVRSTISSSIAVKSSSTAVSNSTYRLTPRHNGKLVARDTCNTVQVVYGDNSTTLASECGITETELATYNPSSNLTVGENVCCTEGTLQLSTPEEQSDGYCATYLVQTGDTCSALAATYTITVDEIESWNTDTWGWMGCGDMLADMYICISSGYSPMPTIISNAVCGPQVNGTATAPQGSDLSDLNECPLNACCDIWGQCGITAEFCTITNSTTGAPGTAANGTNGCISNCGTDIIESDAPSSVFSIGYFEGFDTERTCLRPLITDIDTSAYTHIHMSFATLNSDFSFDLSTIEDQMSDFMGLSGVKRVLTVGGWSFSTDVGTYDIFREAVSSSANRATLVSNTIEVLQAYDLDGIDWDWEYPGEPDIPDIPADTDADAEDFFLFLLELSEEMASSTPGKTLSTTAPSSFWYLKAYPIEAISKVVDYMVMMTYDLHGQWDWNKTNADPGCPTGGCLRSHVNLTETLSALSMITKAGVSSNKVAIGTANYARSFEMAEADCYSPDCHFTGPNSGATPGKCTNTAGYISNIELMEIADGTTPYTYIDVDSNSNIMVWDDTQWAGYMDDDIRSVRGQLYEGLNFLGTAEWAIDLKGTTNSSSSTSACEVKIDPTVWEEDSPTITAVPGCTLIWPPLPLDEPSYIEFPPWPTHLTYQVTITETETWASGSVGTIQVYQTHSVPTEITIAPTNVTALPVWFRTVSSGQSDIYNTPSVEPSPFVYTWTPTIGGNTTIIGGTTSTVSGVTYSTGNLTYISTPWVGVFGGITYINNGTVMPETTTTLTPHPYPTTTATTPDPDLNTKSTKVKTTTSGGGSSEGGGSGPQCTEAPCGTGCTKYCYPGCPLCPPFWGEDIIGGGGGGGGGGGDGDGDGSSSESESQSSTSTGASYTVGAVVTTIYADPYYTTNDPITALEALATQEASLMNGLFGPELSFLATAPTGSITTTSKTTKATTSAKYPYTMTDSSGDVIACESDIVFLYEAGPTTVCEGSSTIISKATTSTTSTTSVHTPCVTVYGTVSDGLSTQFEIDLTEDSDKSDTCSFTCSGIIDDCTGKCDSGYSAKADTGKQFIVDPMTVTLSAPYGEHTLSVKVKDWDEENCCGGEIPCSCYSVTYEGTFLNC